MSEKAKGKGKGPPPPPPKRPSQTSVTLPKVRCGGSVHALFAAAHGEENPGADGAINHAGLLNTSVEQCSDLCAPGGLCEISDGDFAIDLGCGYGDFLVAARRASSKARLCGVELDPKFFAVAKKAADDVTAEVGEEAREIEMICASLDDLPDEFLAETTLIYLFLSQWSLLKMRPRLLRVLRPGTRIILRSYNFGAGWPEDAMVIGRETWEYRRFVVTEERKNDPALLSDAEVEKHYGSHWSQPPPGSYKPYRPSQATQQQAK